jgi:EAL domain-containing protein (putative c-di-GMP-specific phosphodiesterase class I)
MDAHSLSAVESAVVAEPPYTRGVFQGMRLSSHFQAVFSLAHGRAVGYEALLRATGRDNRPTTPLDAFAVAERSGQIVLLDRLARAIHARNFAAQQSGASWLFLNIHPHVIVHGLTHHGPFFGELLESCGITPHHVVIEVVEAALLEDAPLSDALAYYRGLGCLIAIDDFGAGHSNLDRIWRLKPDIVKLDRALVSQASEDRTARQMLPRVVAMLHEAGSLVLMEGVETETQAMIAMDAESDFVQGNYFAPPLPELATSPSGGASFDALYNQFHRLAALEHMDYQSEVDPYAQALVAVAERLEAGQALAEAAAPFLGLPQADRCFVLDRVGRQAGASALAPSATAAADPRFAPIADDSGANWARRHYFRRALLQPGVHMTRPYLSVGTAKLCVTVSTSIRTAAGRFVLCGDIQWNDKISASDLAGTRTEHIRLG